MLRIEDLVVTMDGQDLTGDLVLQEGARVAVLGPSGAGKSTLLDVIAGFRQAEGVLRWKCDVLADRPEDRPISILFQDGNLFPHMTIARNLALALRPDGLRLSPAQNEQVEQALARVGLAGMGPRKPGTLSGGQQSRAALARVLLQARPIILLDEPFSALGPALKQEMLALVQEVADELGALVMMVTHAPDDARRFAQSVVLVANGQVHEPVETEAFFETPPAAFRDYIGQTTD
jgi:thiamine transport system ATP-binding protein